MRMQKANCVTPVITVFAALLLPLVAQDSDRMRESVKRLETALARVESHLQGKSGEGAAQATAQATALEQAQREHEALRVQLAATHAELQRTNAQLATAQAQVAELNRQLEAAHVALATQQREAAQQQQEAAQQGQAAAKAADAHARERDELHREVAGLRAKLDALRAVPPGPEGEAASVPTSAGTVQVHHHGPGDIILNFQPPTPAPTAPPKLRIEI